MTKKRFIIEVLDKNNWLIEDIKTGEFANPVDGTTNVLKGLVSTLNKFNDENEQLKNHIKTLQNNTKRLENQNIQTYNLIKEAYNNERTDLGRSVLKQLLEAIQ